MNHNESAKKKNHQPVKVYIRQRPFSEHELTIGCPNVVQHMTNNELMIKNGINERRYFFDQVFSWETSQREVYEAVVFPLIPCIISGYNCTVFAYGQTGTGKTYTMVGNQTHLDDSSIGLIPRSATHLFEELEGLGSKIEYTVRVSFIEIYNEEVRDLFTNTGLPLKIYDDPDNKGSVCLKGLKEVTVLNSREVNDWFNVGLAERQTASTNMNRHSSRSHCIFTLSVLTRQLTVDGDELIKIGKLYLVDLAGSENLGRSGSTELRAREAGNINKSLLTLGKVIKALAQKAQHVPYRDSKLTRILQDSLGGKTKTCMIATISPASVVWEETLSTLDYAQVARNVSNCPQVNENRKQTNLLKNLKEEIGRLRKELAIARAGEGFYMSRDNYEDLCQNLEHLQSEVGDFKKQVEELKAKNADLEVENSAKDDELKKLKMCYEEVRHELDEKSFEWKREEYVTSYLEKREKELKSAAEQLWKVCEASTKHETLFCQKYERQCEISLKNATIAKNAYSIFGNSLKRLQSATKDHVVRQNNSFNEVHANIACLKENAWKMCKRLSEYSKYIEEDSDESLTMGDLTKGVDSPVAPVFEMQKKSLEELEKYNEAKMKEMEVMTTRCINAMKQLLNDYTMCVNDVMKSQSSLIQKVKNDTKNDEVVLKEAIEQYKDRSHDFVKNLVSDFNDRMTSQVNKTKQLRNRYSQEIENIKSQFTVEAEDKVNELYVGLKLVERNQNNFEKSVRNFAEETLDQIRREIEENVQFVIHVGDTPCRPNYFYPRKLDNKLSRSALYEQFKDSYN